MTETEHDIAKSIDATRVALDRLTPEQFEDVRAMVRRQMEAFLDSPEWRGNSQRKETRT